MNIRLVSGVLYCGFEYVALMHELVSSYLADVKLVKLLLSSGFCHTVYHTRPWVWIGSAFGGITCFEILRNVCHDDTQAKCEPNNFCARLRQVRKG